MKALLGRKLGMTQIFGDSGEAIPVTVIQAGPCVVTQLKSETKDGYTASSLVSVSSSGQVRARLVIAVLPSKSPAIFSRPVSLPRRCRASK